MNGLKGKRILLGITGSIAAYKSPEIIRLLRKSEADVRVILSRGGEDFVTPLTLQALSENPVFLAHQSMEQESKMSHIELAEWADTILIAPASANVIARLAHGFADDLLSLVCTVSKAPIILAPAMNVNMWENIAIQANVALLRDRGVRFIGPAFGTQACGAIGEGRMEEPESIVSELTSKSLQDRGKLQGKRVLITAGPTSEPIDPVRVITNRSSGRMGYSIAEAARNLGAEVTLITGPTFIEKPKDVAIIQAQTADAMHQAVMANIMNQDVFIGCAAVSDYRINNPSSSKLKKDGKNLTLELKETEDILANVGKMTHKRPFIIGFAAETENLAENAKRKLKTKHADLIIGNQVSDDQGFGDVNSEIVIVGAEADIYFKGSKASLGRSIMDFVAERLETTSLKTA